MSIKQNDTIDKMARIAELVAERTRDDYDSLRNRLEKARELFDAVLADRFVAAFNAHLRDLPSQTLEQKQHIANTANADLRKLNLTIRCPKTGRPALLRGDPGYNRDCGRFQLYLLGESGRGRTCSSTDLFDLKLMGSPASSTVRPVKISSWEKLVSTSKPAGSRSK